MPSATVRTISKHSGRLLIPVSILELSLTLSFVYSLLEVYAIGRILSLTYSQSRHVMNWLGDQPVLQSFSLLILELLTVVPSAIFTGILGEFIPFSIGTIIVLRTYPLCYPDFGENSHLLCYSHLSSYTVYSQRVLRWTFRCNSGARLLLEVKPVCPVYSVLSVVLSTSTFCATISGILDNTCLDLSSVFVQVPR